MVTIAALVGESHPPLVGESHPPLALGIAAHNGANGLEDRVSRELLRLSGPDPQPRLIDRVHHMISARSTTASPSISSVTVFLRMSDNSAIAGRVDSIGVTGDDFAAVACRQSPDGGKCCRGLDEPDRAVHVEKIGPTGVL
jgi:hypothetical protein